MNLIFFLLFALGGIWTRELNRDANFMNSWKILTKNSYVKYKYYKTSQRHISKNLNRDVIEWRISYVMLGKVLGKCLI